MAKLSAKAWGLGLLVALVSGAAHGGGAMFIDPSDFNIHAGLHKLLMFMVFGALKDGLLFLYKHPVPNVDEDVPEVEGKRE
jgi:hypothetical protein